MMRSIITAWFSAVAIAVALSGAAEAQLQITEIMYNTVAVNDNGWEWIEVRNTGGSPVDLNGAFLDRIGDPQITSTTPNISNANAMNTIIPAGGVAVIYDGFVSSGSPANYNDQIFRDSWGLSASIPLIAADFFPFLVNSNGGSIGIWADKAAYDMDIDSTDPLNPVVGSFANALTGISFGHSSPWPPGAESEGLSIEWSGNGSNTDGGEWSFSGVGSRGAVFSTPGIGQGGVINNTQDYGNPGDVFSSASVTGTIAAGLYISEIMYNPASSEPNWEWVEIYNHTGEAIDFSATPYVFDDDDDANLTAANVTSGMIPSEGIAVLYNNVLTQDQVEGAWGSDINFIPVSNFTSFGNGGDLVALWSSLEAYQLETDPNPGPSRTADNAIAQVLYSNNENGFPDDNGASSIYVSSFTEGSGPVTGDYNEDGVVDAADYALWRDSIGTQQAYSDWRENFGTTGGGGTVLTWALDIPPAGQSFSPESVFGNVTVHPGGDVASPGTFIPISSGTGTAVPEPTSIALLLVCLAGAALVRRS